jgi:hypothetical protein
MRTRLFASAAVTLAILASGIVASTNVGVGAAGGAEYASKAAFCGANESITRADAKVDSVAGFLAALKSHTHQLAVMKKNAPSGAVGQTVQQLVSGAEAAISANNANALNNLPSGGPVDTYCGVDGSGNPLPSYFGKGKASAFCSTFLPIFQAVSNATGPAGVLAALTTNKAQVNQLASELSTLPRSIKAKATTTVDKAQTAITTNSAAAIQGNGSGAAMYVALYCGQNE